MGFFRPQDGRTLAGFFSNMVKKWDALTPEEKASGWCCYRSRSRWWKCSFESPVFTRPLRSEVRVGQN